MYLYPPPPRKLCLLRVYCFHFERPCVRPSVTFCFLNILKSHCWNFIKPCKHIHIYKTKTFLKKSVRVISLCSSKYLFYIEVYAYAIIIHTRADQLLPQLPMKQFDTMTIQRRHIGHMHEGVCLDFF